MNTGGGENEREGRTMNPLIRLKRAIPLFLIALAFFGFSPMAQALLPPPSPDGGYPGGNTAEGDLALFNLTTGSTNTAMGIVRSFATRSAASTRPPVSMRSLTT